MIYYYYYYYFSTQYEIGDDQSPITKFKWLNELLTFSFTFSIKEILLSIVFVLGSEMMEHLNKDSNSYLTSVLLITAQQ
jgi:hypothetical protein